MCWGAGNEGNTSEKAKTKSGKKREGGRQRPEGHVTWSHGEPEPEKGARQRKGNSKRFLGDNGSPIWSRQSEKKAKRKSRR